MYLSVVQNGLETDPSICPPAEKMFELGRTAVVQGVEAEMEGGLPIREK